MPEKPDQPWMPSRPESVGASDRWVVLLVLGFCSLGVAAACSVAFAMYWFLLRGPDFVPVAVESREQKRAALAAAFSADELGVEEATLAPIRELFDRIQECASDDDFRKLVHADRFFRATIESDAMPPQPRFAYERFRAATRDSVYRPWETVRYRLRYIEPLADGEFVAYGYFWDIHGDLMEMRWWLTRDHDKWMVYDWELLQVGMRRSRLLALYFKGPSDSYNRFYEDLNAAYASLGEYEHDEGRAALLRAERWLPTIPEELRAEPAIWAAMYWCSLEDYDEAVRVASLLPNPEDVPGVHTMRLMQAHENDQHERVLEYCVALDSALGPTPTAARYRAEALDKLGRRDEATAAISQLLRLDSESATSLGRLALALSANHIDQVVSAWNADERSGNARRLAEALIDFGDLETGRALAKSVESEADRAFIEGLLAEEENDDIAAAGLFLNAMQQSADAESATDFRVRYLTTMSQLGRIVGAYQAMPEEHADSAFLTLLSQDEDSLESYLPVDQQRALLAAHAERGVDDPQWHMASGDVAQQQGDLDAAVDAYRRALALIDEDSEETGISWMLPSKLRSVQAQMPEGWRIAYADADEPVTAFAEIASALSSTKRWNDLTQLVDTHATAHPEDLMAEYYRGLALLEQGHPSSAESCLAKTQALIETPPDEWDYQRDQFRDLRIRAFLSMNNPSAVYSDPALRPSAFTHLEPYYRERQQEGELATLARQSREDEPHDPSGWQCAANLYARAHDDSALAELLNAAPWSEIDFDDHQRRGYEWRSLAQQRFRCLLRLRRFDEADAALQVLMDDDESVLNEQIVLSALRGDVEKTRQLLREREPWLYGSPFDEEDAADVLWSDAFRDIREEHPPQMPAFISGRQWILLQKSPTALTTADIEARVTSALGPTAVVSPLVNADPDDPPAWLVRDGDTRMALCAADEPYTGSTAPSPAEFPDTADFSIMREHRAWIEVSVLSQSNSDVSQENARAALLLRAMAEDNALAIYDSEHSRIIDAGPELDEYLSQDLPPPDGGEAEPVYLSRSGEAVRGTMLSEWLRRPLRVFALECYRGGKQEWTVTVRIGCGEAAETVTMVVENVEPNDYSGWTYVGRLTSDSQLSPRLRAGERTTFSDWLVSDWTIATPVGLRHGREEAQARWEALQAVPAAPPDSTTAPVGDSAQ